MEGKTNRLLALEGLRGIAAIGVVVYHALFIFYAMIFVGIDSGYAPFQHMPYEDNLYGNPISFIFSGTFAVAIFFVLSGFVLSVGFFETGDQNIIKKLAAKRYIRLMLPAFASVMIAWLLISLGLSFNQQAFVITQSGWLQDMWNFTPSFYEALFQATWGIFVTGQNSYNPVLWTMLFEFVGSFIIFLVLLLFGKLNKRWIIYIALIIATFQTWYLGFILGMILADLYVNKKFPFNNSSIKLLSLGLVVGLFLGAYPAHGANGTLYETLSLQILTNGSNQSLYLILGACLVLIAVIGIPVIEKSLSSSRINILGRYTFSLYLVHKLVLFTFCTGIFLLLYPSIGYNLAAVLSILISLPVIALATWIFEKYIDAPSIRISGVFANWLFGFPQKSGSTAFSEKTPRKYKKNILTKLLNQFLSAFIKKRRDSEKF